jgi:hypothetical protein
MSNLTVTSHVLDAEPGGPQLKVAAKCYTSGKSSTENVQGLTLFFAHCIGGRMFAMLILMKLPKTDLKLFLATCIVQTKNNGSLPLNGFSPSNKSNNRVSESERLGLLTGRIMAIRPFLIVAPCGSYQKASVSRWSGCRLSTQTNTPQP